MTSLLIAIALSISSAPDSTKMLDEIVVEEVATKVPVALLPLDVRTIDETTISESHEPNILPVLENQIPGMFVSKRSIGGYGISDGAAGTVAIRGIGGGNKVLFLIDGQPQWAGLFGHSLPDTYVTNDIKSVEVVSGPSSVFYGSGAMGGSVNLITQRASAEGLSGSIRAMGGSYASQNYAARIGYNHKALNICAAASYESTDGNRDDMDFRAANQYLSARYTLSEHWETGANTMFTESKADNPGSIHRDMPLEMWTKIFRTTTSAYIKNHYSICSGGLQTYYNWGKHKVDDGLDANNKPRTYTFQSEDYNLGFTLYQTLNLWNANALSLGFDFKQWGGTARNVDKETDEATQLVKTHVNETAGYAMMQQSFADNLISLNAGIRLEHSSQFGNEWIPQTGFILNPWRSSKIKFNYAKGFRSPNIRELYMYPPHNPDLMPERMHNYEVAYRQYLLNNRLNFGAAIYYINGTNLIQKIMLDGKPKNVNTGKFINKGFELDFTFNLTDEWRITANYAYLHTSTRIVGAPTNKLFGEIEYRHGNWHLSVDCMSIWQLHTEESTESYALLNAQAAYQFDFNKPLTIFIKGENLTATNYEINYGFPMPRATIMAGAEWRF